jgi:hypothetical protein
MTSKSKNKSLEKGLELLKGIDELLTLIVQSSEQLLRLTKKEFDEDKLDELQCSQDTLINQLKTLDENYTTFLDDETPPKSHKILSNEIKDKLLQFEKYNHSFIENIEVRRGLIKIEMHEIDKRKHVLNKINKAYSSDLKKSKKKIDTLK